MILYRRGFVDRWGKAQRKPPNPDDKQQVAKRDAARQVDDIAATLPMDAVLHFDRTATAGEKDPVRGGELVAAKMHAELERNAVI